MARDGILERGPMKLYIALQLSRVPGNGGWWVIPSPKNLPIKDRMLVTDRLDLFLGCVTVPLLFQYRIDWETDWFRQYLCGRYTFKFLVLCVSPIVSDCSLLHERRNRPVLVDT